MEQQPIPIADRNGHPWSEYVRTVQFVDDDPVGVDAPPCHVMTGGVLLDGQYLLSGVDPNGITVDLSPKDATIVTMPIDRTLVQIGSLGDDGVYIPHTILGRLVHTPVGDGWQWAPQDPDDPSNPYIMCSFMVAEVHVR